MDVRRLSKYEFPEGMIESWVEQGIETLQPIQSKAILNHHLFEGRNLVISAPTSSGKTFIGELAAVHNALQGRKSVYLVPTKALAEEKFLSFSELYTKFGIRVVISTRDRKEFDHKLANGHFEIAIIVFEKFFQLLNSASTILSEISIVVIDELQLLADVERGANIELLLTRLKMIQGDFQLIGLSAVIGNSRVLPEWLKADFLVDYSRPVELRMGYVSEGVYHYRTFNSCENGTEEFIPGFADNKKETMVAVAQHLAERGEQSLIFLPDKDSTRRMVWRLDGKVDLPKAEKAIEELQQLEATLSRDLLIEALENGMAFHNADLSAEERVIIEKYFRLSEIKILVSTTTLAMGVNLPAKNVILDLEFWQSSAGSRRYFLSLMKRSDFENITGRAGRFGLESEFGRAIVIATSLKDREVFRHKYLEGEMEHIKPQLWEGSMATAVMNAVALVDCRSVDAIKKFLRSSLTWKLYTSVYETSKDLEKELEYGINTCFRSEILLEDDEGDIYLSHLGSAAVNMGISVETALTINKWLNMRGDRSGFDDLELMFIASITDDGLDAYLNLSTKSYHELCDKLRTRFSNEIGQYAFQQFQQLIKRREMNDYMLTKCIRNSYAYRDYIGDVTNREVEDLYNLCLGSIRNTAEHISWVIWAAAEVAKKLGYSKELVKQISILAERMQYGVNSAGIALARLRVPGLGRERIRALVHQGFDTVEAIKELSVEDLARWVTKPVANRLKKAVLQDKIDEKGAKNGSDSDPAILSEDRLELLGAMEKRRTLIKLNGQTIGLRDREFEVLLKLAMSRLESEEGWVNKYDLGLPEAGITQGISRLREAISDYQLNPDKSLIENNDGHYRIILPVENINLNREKLRRHLSATVHELVA